MMTAKELSKLITTGRKLKKFIKETLPKIREEFQSHSNSGIDKHRWIWQKGEYSEYEYK